MSRRNKQRLRELKSQQRMHPTVKRPQQGSDENCEPNDIRASAYHEAGHAVAATVLEIGLTSASIRGHLGNGAPGTAMKWAPRGLEDPEYYRRMMVAINAGPMAEELVLRESATPCVHEDDVKALQIFAFRSCGLGTLKDDGQFFFSEKESQLAGHIPRVQAASEDAFVRTAEFLADHWEAIKAVAMALLDSKSLTGDEVAEIVRAALPSPPAPKSPA